MVFQPEIGENIKNVRLSKNMRQQDLAESCGFSNTTLSAYENNKKRPSIDTIATIAKHLGVSIDRLYYGDENNAFISAAPNEGRKIVNSIYCLWEQGVIWYNDGIVKRVNCRRDYDIDSMTIGICKYPIAISRLLTHLYEFRSNKDTFSDPDGYLEMLLSSVAEEINNSIKNENAKPISTKSTK